MKVGWFFNLKSLIAKVSYPNTCNMDTRDTLFIPQFSVELHCPFGWQLPRQWALGSDFFLGFAFELPSFEVILTPFSCIYQFQGCNLICEGHNELIVYKEFLLCFMTILYWLQATTISASTSKSPLPSIYDLHCNFNSAKICSLNQLVGSEEAYQQIQSFLSMLQLADLKYVDMLVELLIVSLQATCMLKRP